MSQSYQKTPKKFLKKGEGLKRFAAYNPPLPVTGTKVQRRQTFVKFKIDPKPKREHINYLPPEILCNESINLSTEIPRIAPPKIIHTPIRPSRQALGALKVNNLSCDDETLDEDDDESLVVVQEPVAPVSRRTRRQIKATVQRHISPVTRQSSRRNNNHKLESSDDENKVHLDETQINGNIDCLLRKIKVKKCVLDEEREEKSKKNINKQFTPPSPNYTKVEQPVAPLTTHKTPAKKTRTPHTTLPPIATTNTITTSTTTTRTPPFNLAQTVPTGCILALGKHIQKLQATVNELKERVKSCGCGAELSTPKPKVQTRVSTRNAAKSKANDKKQRPSANADNNNISTPKIIRALDEDLAEIAALRARLDEFELQRGT